MLTSTGRCWTETRHRVELVFPWKDNFKQTKSSVALREAERELVAWRIGAGLCGSFLSHEINRFESQTNRK